MQEKSVILTPNKRLARDLQANFYKEKKQKTYLSKNILPLTTWIANIWIRSPDPRILLTPNQEKLIWQKIIAENIGEEFITISTFAINFHELTNSWQLSSLNPTKEEIVVFQNIYKKFKLYCKNRQLISHYELINHIYPYILEQNLTEIIFAGFDEYSPQLQNLIDFLTKNGIKITKSDPNKQKNAILKRLSCNNLKEEIKLCAEWAKNCSKNENIGVIAPNLDKIRPKISQIFTEIVKNFNISLGKPLKSFPIINTAINLLSLQNPIILEEFNKILLSPYVFDAENESYRAILSIKLQKHKKPESKINISDINDKSGFITETVQKWQKFLLKTEDKSLYSSEWAKIFTEILQIFKWPGESNLTNEETTSIEIFTNTLQEFAKTDHMLSKITYKKALLILQELIAKTSQPDPETNSNINIMGPLEALGLNFDRLWIMGLDQESWPAKPHPNPFIPFHEQKKLSLPHSSSQRELQFGLTMIERYKRSAKNIIFSYVKYNEDRNIPPSPLIKDIPETSIKELKLTNSILNTEKIYRSKKLEQLVDNLAPKLSTDEIDHANSKLIELQSLCPFKAFMEFRLNIKEPQKVVEGISRINRGILLHKILELFWQKTKTQEKLNSLDQKQLQIFIESCTTEALDGLSITKELYILEKKCLISLVTKWLEIEKTRPEFKVTATEKSVNINLSNLPIKLRIDRIDEIENNKKLLIDYKTGKNLPSAFEWFGERPKSPQFPLYALAINQIAGFVLAQINSDTIKFKETNLKNIAFATRNTDLKEKNITWDNLINYWQRVLTKIAEDFKSGKANPTPLSPTICKQCSFSSVCRIEEKGG